MKPPVKDTDLIAKIPGTHPGNFNELALEVFNFQFHHNSLYNRFCNLVKADPDHIHSPEQIPFLPISFFKTHTVTTTSFEPETTFESSGTTTSINSRHLVRSVDLYRKSFSNTFKHFYGDPSGYCILALLPSYLERQHSSLVMMADELICKSGHPASGFYLNEFDRLAKVLQELNAHQQPTLLLGVTFALLDFAEQFPQPLPSTIIMETGGMKGRRTELTRQEVHEILQQAFRQKNIHSEYGMTELLSQGYSKANGIFYPAPWMKVLVRAEDDPFLVQSATNGTVINGAINVIDLANIYSCSFIATDDAGKLHSDDSFEVLGRLDNSDIRGCSLMAL